MKTTVEREYELALLASDYCTATSKQSGQRCGNHAIPGGNVCRFHGGSAPQVRAAAARRVGAIRDLAMDRLEERLQPTESPLYEVDPKVLADIVDKFTKIEQLLTGGATERKEERRIEDLRVQFEQRLQSLGSRLQGDIVDVDAIEDD